MQTLTPTLTRAPRTYHGGNGLPPSPGGDGNGQGSGNGSPDYGRRLRRARLGLAIGLTPVIMLFVSFTSAYVFRKGLQVIDDHTQQYVRDWLPVHLPWVLLMINTAVLVLSSVTMERARRSVIREMALAPVRSIPGVSLGKERRLPWLGFTVILGLGFLSGQFLAWRGLADRGFFMSTTPSSSFVYLLTGMHAIHLAGGVFALAYAGTTALLQGPLETRRIVVDITAWYWHFMALLWIYIFALLAIAR